MKHPGTIIWLCFLTIAAPLICFAQQGVVSAGGEASGTGGTMSFSTGQTDFMYFTSETGSIQFGLQQVFFFEEDPDPEIPLSRQLTSGDIFQGEDQCFDALETIILAGGGDTFVVEAETFVELIAGQNILMLAGTMVEYGGYMHARISTDGLFCDVEDPIVASLEVYEPEFDAPQQPLITKEPDGSGKPFFRVYPNPTTGDFTLEIIAGNMDTHYGIEVFGMRGELIMRYEKLMEWQQTLSLQGCQPGLYMIRVQRGDEVGVERMVKR